MHHLYPLVKGDPLCPLGFHPQVRWPTRCKRCFRDYKEHGGKRRDEDGPLRKDTSTASTPTLSTWGSKDGDRDKRRNWASSTNLADKEKANSDFNNPSSWTSTPDLANLEDDTQANIPTVSLTLPKRKQKPIDSGQRTVSDSFSIVKPPPSTFNRTDSLATRAKKLKAIKEASVNQAKRIQIKEVRTINEEPTNHDVQFLIQVKTKAAAVSKEEADSENDDNVSLAGTETTDTTLVDPHDHELREQLESMRLELETTKAKCDRLEREKSDILLRRLAAMETTTSKTTATEVLKLQQKCNDLQSQLEEYKDDKKCLSLRVKELEGDLEARPTAQAAQKVADELRSKLLAAETLCEELMDENEDMKKEMRDLEEQMDEMQDNFREDQAIEYSSLKKELEQTTKNCRILSFKLRKTERRTEQLETEKSDVEKKLGEISGGQSTLERIKHLEQELKVSNEVCITLQKELSETSDKLTKAEEAAKLPATKKKAPMLGSIGKNPSGDGKPSRQSLTRGGSQDDPAQLLRDLQDSLEREADLREQLKFAEEEAQNLRKKVSRIEDDNESLVLQLKKMATQSRGRKLSPTNSRLTPEPPAEKSDEEDPAELKLLLELNEQEATVLRKKIEELELDNERLDNKLKEVQEKLTTKAVPKKTIFGGEKGNSIQDKKLKVLEEETNDLRKKLIEKERDCERLHAEISLNQKRSKGIQKSKSLDMDQQTLDLKRQLQVIEQEATVLRSKVQSLEVENEKLTSENKKLALLRGNKKFGNKFSEQIASLENELEVANKKIRELEEEMEFVKLSDTKSPTLESILKKIKEDTRLKKKASTLTPKEQLVTMVNDLEKEISEIAVALKHSESIKSDLEKELKALKGSTTKAKGSDDTVKELKETKSKISLLEKEIANERMNSKGIREEKSKIDNDYQKLKEKFEKSEERITQLNKELDVVTGKQNDYKKKFEDLKSNVEVKEKELEDFKKELVEKSAIVKELSVKTKKVVDLENKLQEFEDKIKKLEKTKKDQIRQLESKIEEEKDKNRLKDTENQELSGKFSNESRGLNIQIDELNSKVKAMENIVSSKNTLIQQLEESLKKERENVTHTGKVDNKEMNSLRDQLNKSIANLSEVQSNLETLQKSKKTVENKSKRIESELKKEKIGLEKKVAEMEVDLQNEKKKIEVIKTSQQKEQKNRELELNALKGKIKSLELNSGAGKKVSEIKLDYQERIDKLEKAIHIEKQEYEELTAKYEILEEEHVVTKAKLVIEKETLNNQLIASKREVENLETELQKIKDTYNEMQNSWIKEKVTLQEKLKESEKKTQESHKSINMEKNTFKSSLEQKHKELDQIKKEYNVLNDQLEYLRKENDELKKKLDDFDKVHKVQRNISADSSAMEKEIRQLTSKLNIADKMKKSDLAQCKMRYENQMAIISDEMKSLQTQVMRFKRERDTYKHMLEGAQKTIGDLKAGPSKSGRESRSSICYDELEESRTKIATLEQQISCMEDELSEVRLESSKYKTTLVSERTSWEVKMSELHSRVNELEEEKILSSGRTKIVGLRTKMELAWQKEREEQQRLLQETATLARDLRQTLFEVERERDKERLEGKRKQEQLKKSSEEDHDESRRKLTELQCDLLELRDAHAKLRTTNEKLRREKERHEKEREELRQLASGKKRTDQDDERRINALINQVETLMNVAPELFGNKSDDSKYLPTPPRRTKSSLSRESSPAIDHNNEDTKSQIPSILQRLADATEELKRTQRFNEEDRERERIKRVMGTRRATSSEHENIPNKQPSNKNFVRNGTTNSSLHRKSLSLEHTLHNEQQSIWKGDDDSLSSMQSLDGASDVERWSRRDTSLDSRLSGGSTQSEVSVQKKKKKGIIGKLKKITKSRSIDDQDPEYFSPNRPISSRQGSGSDVEDTRGSKKDLKERLTGMFKRSGSSSRSNSLDRLKSEAKTDTSSTQRPLMRASPQTDREKTPVKKK